MLCNVHSALACVNILDLHGWPRLFLFWCPATTRWFELIVHTEVTEVWMWREGCHVTGVSYWDFGGDHVNLSVGYNKSACDGCDVGLSSLKYLINPFKVYIFRTFQIPDAR